MSFTVKELAEELNKLPQMVFTHSHSDAERQYVFFVDLLGGWQICVQSNGTSSEGAKLLIIRGGENQGFPFGHPGSIQKFLAFARARAAQLA